MKKLKELYSSPTTEFFEVRFEGNILSGAGPDNTAGKEWGEDPEDEEIIEGGSF